MVRCRAHDLFTVAKREITREGYLVAPAILGRCGIQVYTRGELGLDGDAAAPVRLMRLPDEVLRPETIASFESKPITHRHPEEGVDASSWPELAKGHVRDIAKQPGDLLGGTVWVMDAEQVQRVVAGDVDLSCGYTFDLDLTPGTAPDGAAYDGLQRNILGDHLAILDRSVDSPRGGPICRIGDQKQKGQTPMAMKKLAVDGLPRFEIDELAADAIETRFKVVTAERDQAVADVARAAKDGKANATALKELVLDGKVVTPAEMVARVAADAGKIAELQKKVLTDAQLDALVETRATERATVLSAADALGVKVDPAGKTLPQLRREILVSAVAADEQTKTVVQAVLGTTGIDKADDATVTTLVTTLGAQAKGRSSDVSAQDAAVMRALSGSSSTPSGANDGKTIEVDLEANENILIGEAALA